MDNILNTNKFFYEYDTIYKDLHDKTIDLFRDYLITNSKKVHEELLTVHKKFIKHENNLKKGLIECNKLEV